MLKEKKAVFLIYDKKIASCFNKLLSKNLEIETELEDYGCHSLVSVSVRNYQKALEEGIILANLNHWDMSWMNAYSEPRPIGYISIMCSSLPKTREAESLWEFFQFPGRCPIDIYEYIEKLKDFLCGRSIKIKYNSSMHTIEFLIRGLLEDYEFVKKQCEKFLYLVENSPFIKTTFLEKDGTLIKTEIEEEKEESTLKSYFNESAFVDGLLCPMESNIISKTDSEQDLSTGYKYNVREFGVRNFNILSVDTDDSIENIEGTFLVYEKKDYNFYWNNERKEKTICKSVMPFIMLDNGVFISHITILDEETVLVSTNVNVIRNIVGWNFDGKSVRDGFFSFLAHEDCKGTLELNEYYKIISNRTRLLHYSLSSDFFEVYDLPHGWDVRDGIAKLECPKVFDAVNFDRHDKDLEEIHRIFMSRTTSKGIPLVKR